MVFCQKLVFLGLTLGLLAHSVSGGPVVGTACVVSCHAAWVACVAGLSWLSGGLAFVPSVPTCGVAYLECVQLCAAVIVLPITP